ncbi:hypothetical protein D3C87_2095590 [compost metagenome]
MLGRDAAKGAGAVVDDHRLPGFLADFGGHGARQAIGGAARRGADHDGDRARGEALGGNNGAQR